MAPPPMDIDVPSGPFRIGHYEALERLGSGGFAAVYRARDVRSGSFVALKIVPPGTDDESVRRLMREARAVSRMAHPNVVKVFECGVTDEGAFVAMELLEGRTLQDVLDESGPMEVPRALDIALQVLDGLAAAHESRIIHRDVKPGNIFITRDPTGREIPHVLDFGVSKLGAGTGTTSQQDRTLPGTALGTPGYMAPEQYGSAHAADARADVYGVAATLYAMLTGRLPFDAATYESWLIKVKGERAPNIHSLAPHLPASLARAIDRALARDPDARWPTAREFARALRASAPDGMEQTGRGFSEQSFVDTTAPALLRNDRPRAGNPNVTAPLSPPVSPTTPRMDPEPALKKGSAAPSERDPLSDLATPRPPQAPDARPRRTDRPERVEKSDPGGSRKRRRRSSGGGLWFASGALVGALLAALGAALAFWARAQQTPEPKPPPAVTTTPNGR